MADRFRPPPLRPYQGRLAAAMAQLGARPALQSTGAFDDDAPTIDPQGDSLLQQARDRVAAELGRHRDEELRAALTRALGDGWTPEALAGRTAHVLATDTYLLDGRPLVRFKPPAFSQIGTHLHWSVDVERFEWRPEP